MSRALRPIIKAFWFHLSLPIGKLSWQSFDKSNAELSSCRLVDPWGRIIPLNMLSSFIS